MDKPRLTLRIGIVLICAFIPILVYVHVTTLMLTFAIIFGVICGVTGVAMGQLSCEGEINRLRRYKAIAEKLKEKRDEERRIISK